MRILLPVQTNARLSPGVIEAVQQAAHRGDVVHVVSFMPPDLHWYSGWSEDRRVWRDRERAATRRALKVELERIGLPTDHVDVCVRREDSIAADIVGYARRHQIQQIFIPTRGHTGLFRWLLGSVSAEVAVRAPCRVEVLH